MYHASYSSRYSAVHFRRCITVSGWTQHSPWRAGSAPPGAAGAVAPLPQHEIVQSTAVLDDYFLSPEERAAYARGGSGAASRPADAQRRGSASSATTNEAAAPAADHAARSHSRDRADSDAADMVVGAAAAADAAEAAADAAAPQLAGTQTGAAVLIMATEAAPARDTGARRDSQELAVMGLPVGPAAATVGPRAATATDR